METRRQSIDTGRRSYRYSWIKPSDMRLIRELGISAIDSKFRSPQTNLSSSSSEGETDNENEDDDDDSERISKIGVLEEESFQHCTAFGKF